MKVLVTGANRGIGLGFVRHYLQQGDEVWACYRTNSGALPELACDRLHLLRWDVGTDQGPEGELPEHLDILINNAGIYGPDKQGQSLQQISSAAMQEVFNVDCIGPLRVVQRLHRHMPAGSLIANIGSKMGSVADNRSGGTYAYRAAKAALVIVSRSMAVDLAADGIHVLTLHPGWVSTDMTRHGGLIDVATSVAGMTQVLARCRDYPSGSFVAFDGSLVPF